MMLRVAWYLPQTDCLGPGRRFALWVQGCRRRCAGCIAPTLQPEEGGTLMSTEQLAEEILQTPEIEGITVSGGEPFLQSLALAELIGRVRRQRPALGVIVYTGSTHEALLQEPDAAGLLRQTDLLIDGAYVEALDDGRAMRGSSNQRLLFLTERYRELPMPAHRTNELRFAGGMMRMIGIPSAAAREMLNVFTEEADP